MVDFRSLLESGDFSDLKIICDDGGEFYVHKAVLCPQSDFFNTSRRIDMKEKAESLVTLPEPSSVMKSLLNFCYAPSPRNTYVDPIIDVNDPTYALAHHAALYWAADKYIIDELKDWAFSYLDDFLSVTNNDLIADLNPSHDEDDHSETTKRWKTKFFDLCKAVDTLLECTADDDEIRRALENIEWGRFALKNLPEGLGGACGEISGLCC